MPLQSASGGTETSEVGFLTSRDPMQGKKTGCGEQP